MNRPPVLAATVPALVSTLINRRGPVTEAPASLVRMALHCATRNIKQKVRIIEYSLHGHVVEPDPHLKSAIR